MDFIDDLPPSNSESTILVVVDRLSKTSHFVALTHPYTTKEVAEKIVENIIKLHSMPWSIICDRDPILLAIFGKKEI